MQSKTNMTLFAGLALLAFVVLPALPCGAAQASDEPQPSQEPPVFHGVTLELGEHTIRVWLEQDGETVERGEDGVYHLLDRPFDIVTDQEEKIDGLHLSLIVFDEAEVIGPVADALERGEPIVRLSGRMAAWDHRVPWIDDELIICPATQEEVAATDPLGDDYAPDVGELDGLYDTKPWVMFSVTCPLNWDPETNGLCNRKTLYGFDDEDIFVSDPPLAMLVGLEQSCSDRFLEYRCQPILVAFDR